MGLHERIVNHDEKISIVGLGYVGLPLAISFAGVANVIGFDISREKIQKYHAGIDVTKEVGDQDIKETTAFLTCEEKFLKESLSNHCIMQMLLSFDLYL